MKTRFRTLTIVSLLLGTILPSHAQGYIVANGVSFGGVQVLGYTINVVYNPIDMSSTGFGLSPIGRTPSDTAFINTFQFNPILDVGVRVFLVSENTPISLQPILSQSYPELLLLNNYVLTNGVPFYLGFYTGNQNFYPPNGIYNDPLFGWARMVNNQGAIQMLGSALAYKAEGIFAGTQDIIQPVPEPGTLSLFVLGLLGLGWHLRRRTP